MSANQNIIEVTNLSPNATERDLYDFFAFSGPIEHIEIMRSGESASTAYVTFKDLHAAETAVLLSEAIIVDQRVCISHWGRDDGSSNFWSRNSWRIEDEDGHNASDVHEYWTTPGSALTMTQEVVKTMLAKGYTLGKDALSKAKEFDESHRVSSTAAAKVAELSRGIGLTNKITAGVDAVRSVDERYRVSETTKVAVSTTGRAAAAAADTVLSSRYFSAAALCLSDALGRAAKAAENLSNYGSKR